MNCLIEGPASIIVSTSMMSRFLENHLKYEDSPNKRSSPPSYRSRWSHNGFLHAAFQSTPKSLKSTCPSPTSTLFSTATPSTSSSSSSSLSSLYFTPVRTYASALRASPSSFSTFTINDPILDDDCNDHSDANHDIEMSLDPPVPLATARCHSFHPFAPKPCSLVNSYFTSTHELTKTYHQPTEREIRASASAAADIISITKTPLSLPDTSSTHYVSNNDMYATPTRTCTFLTDDKKKDKTIASITTSTTSMSTPSPVHCKKNLVKTEFCKYILNNEQCKFGSFCNFAHSEEELNYKTLFERHDAGLLDKNTLRTRPCFDFVSTGSCPFGTRCTSIHDPRTKANDPNHQFWLPHCVLETKNLHTDLHIDWFKNYLFMDIHYGHSFGMSSNKTTYGTSSSNSDSTRGKEQGKKMVTMVEDTIMNSFDDFYNAVIQRDSISLTPAAFTPDATGTVSASSASSFQATGGVNFCNNNKNIIPAGKENNIIVSSTTGTVAQKIKKKCLTEVQRIEIELKMRTVGSTGTSNGIFLNNSINAHGKHQNHSNIKSTTVADSMMISNISTALYKYKPSHIIFNEMCMILQTRAFDISRSYHCNKINNNNEDYDRENTVHEIDLRMYNQDNDNHVLVHDIAFGLPGSNNSGVVVNGMTNENNRPRALWFNIKPEDIHVCTVQERLNYKKTCKKLEKVKKMQEMKNNSDYHLHGHNHCMTFDIAEEVYQNGFAEKPIIMNLPMDHNLFVLTNEVLKHRLSVLTKRKYVEDSMNTIMMRHQHEVDEELLRIKRLFDSLKIHLSTFCFWPVNDGRDDVDETTLVPEVVDTYSVPIALNRATDKFAFQSKIWKSFVHCSKTGFKMDSEMRDNNANRLRVFRNLAHPDVVDANYDSCITLAECLPPIWFGGVENKSKNWENVLSNRDWNMVQSFYKKSD